MTMFAFHAVFPEVARNESRSLTPVGQPTLPERPFLLVEQYCTKPNCDCRRVLIGVFDVEQKKQVATINYGFEPPKPPFEDEGQVFLDPLNPQSKMSDALLALFESMIANDPDYRVRLIRHYSMWKRVVDDPSHPAQAVLQVGRPKPAQRASPKVGPNDPCPCGSGRKYKKCCRK